MTMIQVAIRSNQYVCYAIDRLCEAEFAGMLASGRGTGAFQPIKEQVLSLAPDQTAMSRASQGVSRRTTVLAKISSLRAHAIWVQGWPLPRLFNRCESASCPSNDLAGAAVARADVTGSALADMLVSAIV